MFYLEWFPSIGASLSDFGAIKQGELFDGILGIRAIGTGVAYFLRPFDFLAIAPYYRVEWWYSAAVTDNRYTLLICLSHQLVFAQKLFLFLK